MDGTRKPPEKRRTEFLHTRLKPGEREKLQATAAAKGTTMSGLVRAALVDAMAEQGRGHEQDERG